MDVGTYPSIVVITYRRHAAVRRLMSFYADYPGQLVVVDGSPESMADPPVRPGDLYLPMPGAPGYRRIAEGIARVSAETCALGADDDFHVADGLRECARAMASRSEVACVAGTAVYFEPGERSPDRAMADCAVERILDVEDTADPGRRFASVISVGPQVFYSCMRTSVARAVSSALAGLPDRDGLVGEQLWSALPSLFGRVTMVERLQLCRSVGRRDYTGYLAPFGRLSDIAEWESYPMMCERVLALARDAGLDPVRAEAVVGSWRQFAAQTARGRRSWNARKFPLGQSIRRAARNLSSNLGVAARPSAWFDEATRNTVRKSAGRGFLRSSAYPWADQVARREFCRVMAFDAQSAAQASSTASTP
jgi:glycosyltransferase domain-containing protein